MLNFKLGLVVHASNPSTYEADAGGSRVQDLFELYSKINSVHSSLGRCFYDKLTNTVCSFPAIGPDMRNTEPGEKTAGCSIHVHDLHGSSLADSSPPQLLTWQPAPGYFLLNFCLPRMANRDGKRKPRCKF